MPLVKDIRQPSLQGTILYAGEGHYPPSGLVLLLFLLELTRYISTPPIIVALLVATALRHCDLPHIVVTERVT
jgi:hypothetical protein